MKDPESLAGKRMWNREAMTIRRDVHADDAESGEARRDWRIRTDRAADLEIA